MPIVQSLLESLPSTRDDDALLYVEVAKIILPAPYYTYPIIDLLHELNYQSVRATRQWLQLRNEELRGKTRKKRHNLGEEIRKEYSPTFNEKIDAGMPRYNE